MKRALIAAMVMLNSLPGQATAIVIVQEAERIFIGADSLRQLNREPSLLACKIRPIGDGHYAAMAGVSGSVTRDVDVWSLIAAATRSGGTLDEKMARLDRSLPEPLTRLLGGEKTEVIVEVVFIGLGGPDPHLVYREYRARATGGDVEVTAERCPDCWKAGALALGQKTPIRAFWESVPGIADQEPVRFIRASVDAAIRAVPASVGPPLNILEVTRSGARWLQRDETVCAWTP